MDFDQVCEEAGLPGSYVRDENNWVSVVFALRFTEILIEKTGNPAIALESGKQSLSSAQIARHLYWIIRNFVGIEKIYIESSRLATHFSRIQKLSIVKKEKRNILIRLEFDDEGMNEIELKALKTNIPYAFQNTFGYLSSIPTLKSLPPAEVEVTESKSASGLPIYDFHIEWKPERKNGFFGNFLFIFAGSGFIFAILNYLQIMGLSENLLISLSTLTLFLSISVIKSQKLKDQVFAQTMEAMNQLDHRYALLQKSKENAEALAVSYKKFVPDAIFKELNLKQLSDIELGDHKRGYWTAMFIDIRGFTHIAEQLSANEVFQALNQYLKSVAPLIEQNGGWIADIMGDGIFAIFPDAPDRALVAAQQILNSVSNLRLLQDLKIKCGIGISSGEMILGTIGYSQRMQATVIADSVNLASRLEKMTKDLGHPIICDFETYSRLSREIKETASDLGDQSVDGKAKPVRVFAFKKQEQSEITYPGVHLVNFPK